MRLSFIFTGRRPIGRASAIHSNGRWHSKILVPRCATLSRLNLQIAPLQAAATAYQNALAVYQSRSDRLDSANLQFILGVTFEKIAGHEAGIESLHRAVDYYRAAVNGL